MSLIIVAQNQGCAERRADIRQCIKQRSGMSMLQVNDIAGAGDEVRFPGGDLPDHALGASQGLHRIEMTITQMSDTQAVKLLRPGRARSFNLADQDAAGEILS